jgi:hypothetical protein
LRSGFKKLDPRRILPSKIDEAASLSHGDRWLEETALEDMPRLDAIVCSSVAVTCDGRRCAKGEGYSELEFAILRELGHPPVPVATTVHDLQVVDSVPSDPTDQPLSVIATPTHVIRIKRPSAAPAGMDWTRLSAEDLEGRCQVKQPQREIDVGLTVGYPHNVRLRYNPDWHRKRKLDKATRPYPAILRPQLETRVALGPHARRVH